MAHLVHHNKDKREYDCSSEHILMGYCCVFVMDIKRSGTVPSAGQLNFASAEAEWAISIT